MKKTWKIGEYCKGGIITAEVKNGKVLIIGKDWDMSAGCKKSSDQSKAKEFTRLELDSAEGDVMPEAFDFLHDLTTHYYASQVMDWIKKALIKP